MIGSLRALCTTFCPWAWVMQGAFLITHGRLGRYCKIAQAALPDCP